jgi:hypothetical protein
MFYTVRFFRVPDTQNLLKAYLSFCSFRPSDGDCDVQVSVSPGPPRDKKLGPVSLVKDGPIVGAYERKAVFRR